MFKNKSMYYDLYRPNYPPTVMEFLKEKKLLQKNDIIAEFGSGTGKLTSLLLEQGNTVFAFEPDDEMHSLLNKRFCSYSNFHSVKKNAEETEFSEDYFDLIIAAQSFHLFDPIKTKKEFYRIIQPNGKMVFIWYHWDMSQAISHEILNLFYLFRDKQQQRRRTQIGMDFFIDLFYPSIIHHETIDSITQRLSENDFICSMLSSSYATTQDNELHKEFLTKVRSIFKQFAISGFINYSFNLEAYYFSVK